MKRRFVLASVATTLMVIVAFVVPLAVLVRTVAEDRALRSAQLTGQSIASVLALVERDRIAEVLDNTVDGSNGRQVSVVLPDDTVVGVPVEIDADVARARSGRAFDTTIRNGKAVFTPVRAADGQTVVVRIWVPERQLRDGVVPAWFTLGGLAVMLLLVAAVVAERIAGSAVGPVEQLAAAARRLGQGDLNARVEVDGPAELRDMAEAFNQLSSRIEKLLADEREAVADLSHRLRTPLTALRLDVERLPSPSAVARIPAEVDQLVAAVDQLINEARRASRDESAGATDLADVVRDRMAFWAGLAAEQDRECRVDVAPGSYRVDVQPDDVSAVVDALVGNVLAHTPAGTPFSVSVQPAGRGHSRLVVEDTGPGLSSERLARGVSGAGSTGLGLDIVRRTAESSGGGLRLRRRAGAGTRIEVDFGSTATSADRKRAGPREPGSRIRRRARPAALASAGPSTPTDRTQP